MARAEASGTADRAQAVSNEVPMRNGTPLSAFKKIPQTKRSFEGRHLSIYTRFFSSAAAKFPMKESSLRISGTKPVPSASAARLSMTCGRLSMASRCPDISVSASCSRLISKSMEEAIDAAPKLSTRAARG
jgi:hypothetical protein